ncbi:DUF3883 domain-containing protein [Azonexus hydrophilus]|jgi:hypothetical protein|uniref:DUF3883 domain-containing protein n=1 Tax=Azonexus hydrophilus TaxID=418702 RepID=UPI001BBF2A12|nr:DUF3883 domain-containing protein [Azonexus hydrophilus]MBS4019212.1 DUF3883 domain-containing protein [Dechloromonas sp.]
MEWSQIEVEAIVADYLHMLHLELSGQSYNKSAHRKGLLTKLNNRSESAIERKHQNISAILLENGWPYINGYKPLGNYQSTLKAIVEARLRNDQSLDQAALLATVSPAATPLLIDYAKTMVEPPEQHWVARETSPAYRHPQQRDYLEREARNISLGLAGETFVVNFEHLRLRAAGQDRLADKVEHVSQNQGDGLGFDVLSFETDGRERFIEVKTTAFGKETPFFISQNEVGFAREYAEQFHLYRLFDFRRNPRLFDLPGAVEQHCQLSPSNYICRFA